MQFHFGRRPDSQRTRPIDRRHSRKMPEQRKKIYILSRNEGLSNEEIAAQLNTTKRNVESQLSLALKEIRKTISCFFLSLL